MPFTPPHEPRAAMVRAWFASRGWTPHAFQTNAWEAFAAGESGVVHVPTGAGKTYAAYGGPLIEMIDELRSTAAPLSGLRLLYITPLRAVSRDIEAALLAPITEIGLPLSVESRTGDTKASVRTRQQTRLPNVLVTTPESLSLLLARATARELLASCRAVIVDEWHELLSSKRGTQTELALARLRGFSPGLRTWALSATLSNLDEAARAAAGISAVEPRVISAPVERPITIHTLLPERSDAFPWAGHLGLTMLDEVVEWINPSCSTLVFTNTRSQAERWHHAIVQARPEWARHTGLHHGSVDRAERERLEKGLKDGSIRLVVATSSLDLGVDFAPVEEVFQIGSPKGIARLMQRAGRSSHRPGAPCRITCVPTYGLELLEVDAVRRAIAAGVIESRLPVRAPLDVLAQHLVTCGLGGGFRADELYEEVRTAWSYRDLSRADFDWALDLVKTGGATLWAYPDYHRIVEEDGIHRVPSRRIAQLHRLNIGTIVSDATVTLCLPSGRTIGNIEENFVSQLRAGDKFLFAGKVLEFVRMRDLVATAKRSRGTTTFTPIWSGTRLPTTEPLAEMVRQSLQLARDGVTDSPELRAAAGVVAVQARLSIVPGADELLIEIAETREGQHVFMFPFEGRLVHAGIAAVVALRLARLCSATFSIAVNDYGLELLTARDVELEQHLTPALFTSDTLLDDVIASVNMTQLARIRFREVARVSGLVFQAHPGVHKSARQVHASAGLLYDVFNEFDPANLLLGQARREVLEREYEQGRLARTLSRLRESSLRILRVPRPTPLGFPLILERVGGKLSGQSIAERIETMKRQWETGCIETEAAGEPVLLMPERAVYWPARSTLLVADLHLGKSETLAAHGVPIPRGIVDADLARLTRAIRNTGATRVLVLGDLLHATIGTAPALIEQVATWRRTIGAELWLVPGNHDRRIDRVAEAWGLHVCDPVLCEPPFVFVHDPEHSPCDGAEFAWSGHIHPRLRVKGGGDSLSFPCFLLNERAGLLPAFSCFTAGTTVRLELGARAWGVAGDGLVDLSFLASPARIR